MISTRPTRRRLALLVAAALALVAVAAGTGPSASAQVPEGAGDPEIVGGVPVEDAADFPYQVALVSRGVANPFQAQFCGGSLISPDTVLTAAHCVDGEVAGDLAVRTGIVDLVDDIGHRANVRQIRMHPGYDADTSDNDIAVLQLATTLPETPVALAQPSQSGLWPADTLATITGWGDLTGDQNFPTDLHVAQVPVVSDSACNAAYSGSIIVAHMMCAGDLEVGGVDTCQGDSGGPIVVDNGGSPLQIGVTSFGEGCALADFPGVYAQVDAYYGPFLERFLDPDSPPDAPRGLAAGSAFGLVRATWRPPFFDGGTPITGYKVRILPGGRVFNLPATARSLDVRLAPGVTHTFKVKARNAVGLGVAASRSIPLPIP
ncbi:MAG: trypsin-like serine protease [Acidimicrobiales bacterium]|nr:trypsin-like serine protease [Acidimicrobiales bacterium]